MQNHKQAGRALQRTWPTGRDWRSRSGAAASSFQNPLERLFLKHLPPGPERQVQSGPGALCFPDANAHLALCDLDGRGQRHAAGSWPRPAPALARARCSKGLGQLSWLRAANSGPLADRFSHKKGTVKLQLRPRQSPFIAVNHKCRPAQCAQRVGVRAAVPMGSLRAAPRPLRDPRPKLRQRWLARAEFTRLATVSVHFYQQYGGSL